MTDNLSKEKITLSQTKKEVMEFYEQAETNENLAIVTMTYDDPEGTVITTNTSVAALAIMVEHLFNRIPDELKPVILLKVDNGEGFVDVDKVLTFMRTHHRFKNTDLLKHFERDYADETFI